MIDAEAKSGSGSTGGGCHRTGSIRGLLNSEHAAGFAEHAVQDVVDRVELLLPADQRGSQLHDWVAAVVGAAVQAGLEQRGRQEAAQQPLGLSSSLKVSLVALSLTSSMP